MTQIQPTKDTRSLLDRQLAAAQQRMKEKRAAQKAGEEQEATTSSGKPAASRDEVQAQIKADREERARVKAELAAKLDGQKADKQKAKEEKKAAKLAKLAEEKAQKSGSPSHLKKVAKARAKCPKLDARSTKAFDDVIAMGLDVGQLTALSAHLAVQAREMQTVSAAASKPLVLGSTVRITGGNPKFVGLVGEVVYSHKLRAKVQVDGFKDPLYIYTGEAVAVEAKSEEPESEPVPSTEPATSEEPAKVAE